MASSLAKIQAARANGAKSHGPKTAEGKQIASLNALKHGLTASIVVLQNESEEQYQADLRDYLDHFRPQGKPETDLVHQLSAQAARVRCARLNLRRRALASHPLCRRRIRPPGAKNGRPSRLG
jgi:hypothetical protein